MKLFPQDPVKKTFTACGLLIIAMFGFGFALVPLYDVFCEITGLNGKTGGKYQPVEAIRVDRSRTVEVQFLSQVDNKMVWGFKPDVVSVRVHPGETTTISYTANNPTRRPMVAQAIPSLVPNEAVSYFHKTECFCFQEQALGPGEEAQLSLQFIVDPDLPREVHQISLAYTLYDITGDKLASR